MNKDLKTYSLWAQHCAWKKLIDPQFLPIKTRGVRLGSQTLYII